MASEYRIHKPYVLAALPRPLDHNDGRIVAREVYGQKGRRRTELAVGIDGETASVYNVCISRLHSGCRLLMRTQVPASQLITSYPIPPQESFTCPPYSVRVRDSKSNDILRYTFIATKNGSARKMTLFKDVVHADDKTKSTTLAQSLPHSSVRYIAGSSTQSELSPVGDVIAVCQNGDFVYLCGESLVKRWSASSKSAVQDAVAGAIDHFEVESVAKTSLADLKAGLFKNRSEVFGALPNGLEPPLFSMVFKSRSQGSTSRHLVVLAAMPTDSSDSVGFQKLIRLDVTPIGAPVGDDEEPTYQIDVQSGLLLELTPGSASVYDISGAVPKQRSTIQLEGVESFLRLSGPFLLSASLDSLSLFNYQHRSIHAKAALDLSDLPLESQSPKSCQLVTYLRIQDLVVALIDNVLVLIQVEPPRAHGKRRRAGLLIDSIGRGTSMGMRPKKLRSQPPSMEFSTPVPGTMSDAYLANYNEEVQVADEMLGNNEFAKWEDLLRQKFSMRFLQEARPENDSRTNEATADSQEPREWEWMTEDAYPPVDRRWILYAISQVFSVETSLDEPRPRLRLVLTDSTVMTYLVVAGHLTLSNLMMTFRDDLSSEPAECRTLANSLIDCILEADASLALLLNYLQATKLGEVELLLSIQVLMLSMGLISGTQDQKPDSVKLLANESHDGNAQYEMDLDRLEREIAVTEHYLGDESSSRSRGLMLALTKLWRLPAVSTVRALRATLQTDEILALVCLLRAELVRGAWTSPYIDPGRAEAEGSEPPPDGVIALIADLLGRCLDAIGAGGWLFSDVVAWTNKADAKGFLKTLKLEVAAALEGIEGALFLNGIVGEAARFGMVAAKNWASRQTWNGNNPIPMHVEACESRMLPLGLKARQPPTASKVVSGGEVVQRSMREKGHLISQDVEVYSLEKIAV